MVRRILVAGIGGIGGFVLWYILLSPLITHLGIDDGSGHPPASEAADRTTTSLAVYGLIACVVGCGALVTVLGEKLRLIPSQEQVDTSLKPVSIFGTNAQRRASVSMPDSAATPSAEPRPASPTPRPAAAAPKPAAPPADPLAEEVVRRSRQIIAAGKEPELVFMAGEPGGVLTFKHAADKGPAILLFTTPYAASDYIRYVGAKAEVRQLKTADLPGASKSWISRGASEFILNRCPRCPVFLLGELADLSSQSYFKIWAVDRATRWCKGEMEVRKILAHYKTGALAEARASLETIRDHIDCGIPYVYQLIACIAGTQQDAAAKSAACERLKEFGPQFEWSPAYDQHDGEGKRVEILASATAGLLGSFGMAPRQGVESGL